MVKGWVIWYDFAKCGIFSFLEAIVRILKSLIDWKERIVSRMKTALHTRDDPKIWWDIFAFFDFHYGTPVLGVVDTRQKTFKRM